eukprot:TRINITY_DN25614_c0_g1_i1.p1 TRINITY_DN25614_c0_g1~~TRINITY_DN25614_c0_g1_i1.p1  ORF type:complete len:521 (+),score=67.54 TRINITY_DN25614_c0_g1_i1:63-1625(+)
MRRGGEFSVVDVETLAAASVAAHVDQLGFGPYQVLVLLCVGGSILAESVEMGATEPLHRSLSKAYALSEAMQTALPMCCYTGSAIGVAISGVISDALGRKRALVLSNALIVGVLFAMVALPESVSYEIIPLLRFVSGLAAAIGGTAGICLAAESCPSDFRTNMMFGIAAIGATGYLVSSIGLMIFMPHFGEDPSDNWRHFCLFLAAPAAAASVGVCFFVSESPTFSAVKGDEASVQSTLGYIAALNSSPLAGNVRIPRIYKQRANNRTVWSVSEDIRKVFSQYRLFIFALCVVDAAKGFMTAGSSYLWPQLFAKLQTTSSIGPSWLNILASLSPLIGLAIGNRLTCGSNGLSFSIWSLTAAVALGALTIPSMAGDPASLLACVIGVKLCYGPMSALMLLLKVETFPTDVRAHAFAFITLASKVGCVAGPTLAEAMRGKESWNNSDLASFIGRLAAFSVVCCCGGLAIPSNRSSGKPLPDYVAKMSSQGVQGYEGEIYCTFDDPQGIGELEQHITPPIQSC